MTFNTLRITLLLVCAAVAPAVLAAEPDLRQDGWYRWEVAAGPNGQRACCYHWTGGNAKRVGCNLGGGLSGLSIPGDCEANSYSMQIFVEVRDGRVHDIQPLSSDCPVSTEADVRTIDDVSTIESIAWFRRLLDEGAAMADDAIMALSFHPEDEALPVLIEILEDRDQRQYNREQALFWMVQSDSDAAYAYLDRMLD